MKLQIKKLTDTAIVPVKAHATDSGFDLFADEDVIIQPFETVIIKTGISIALPQKHEAQIRPKSGITSKTKLRVQLGTIDEGYRGEVGVIVDNIAPINAGSEKSFYLSINPKPIPAEDAPLGTPIFTYKIRKGDKIAQMVIAPVAHPEVEIVDELDATDRGNAGFGSTGVRNE